MGKYFLKRFGQMLVVLFLVTFFVYLLLDLIPGDPVYAILGNKIRPEQYERVYKELGLDKPFLVRYGEWLSGLVQGDFGRSIYYKVPVVELLAKRLPITFFYKCNRDDDQHFSGNLDGNHFSCAKRKQSGQFYYCFF